MTHCLTIATRKSPLALWQAAHVAELLKKHHSHLNVRFLKISTRGDKLLDQSLATIGGKALFVKELEKKILSGEADMAVHSMKDVPYQLPKGLRIAAILKRESPFDVMVSNQYDDIAELPKNALVGSCSVRRIMQLKALRGDLNFVDLRGNVGTRLQKLDDGNYAAIFLADAGLKRLGLTNRIRQKFSLTQVIPAAGQGAIGIEINENNKKLNELLSPLIDQTSRICVTAERAMNAVLQGNCQMPIAAFAQLSAEKLILTGAVGNLKTGKLLKQTLTGQSQQPTELGKRLAEYFQSAGADIISQN